MEEEIDQPLKDVFKELDKALESLNKVGGDWFHSEESFSTYLSPSAADKYPVIKPNDRDVPRS